MSSVNPLVVKQYIAAAGGTAAPGGEDFQRLEVYNDDTNDATISFANGYTISIPPKAWWRPPTEQYGVFVPDTLTAGATGAVYLYLYNF